MNDADFRKTAPEPGPPRPYRFPHVSRKTLANGLRILVVENHNAPLVSLRALVRSGADHDVAELAGLASLTAELLDEGAGDRDTIQLSEEIGRLGGAIGTGSDWDASYVSIDVLSRRLEPIIAILADVIQRPRLDAESLEKIRTERQTELMQQLDDPGSIAGRRFSNLIYGNGSYGNSTNGTTASVGRITRDDVMRFFRTHYLPNNTSIVVAGDVDPEKAFLWMERAFGAWQMGDEPPRPSISPRTWEKSTLFIIDRPQSVQSEIRIGHLGVPRSCEDYFALSVMNGILGGVFNSRINLNLREKHGYTYGARSTFAFRRQAGPFVISAPVRNEVTRESVEEVFHELRSIRSGELADRELTDTKNYLMGVFPATVQTASDLAGRLVDMELFGLGPDYFDHYRENINAVQKEDVERVAKKYIDPDRAIVVIVGNAEQIREPLAGLDLPTHFLTAEGEAVA